MNKKIIIALAAVIVIAACFLWPDRQNRELCISVRTSGRGLQILRDGEWEAFEIRGVNIGSSYPGAFANEGNIPDEAYSRWFEQIGAMNANTVRVYNLQPPGFYTALAQYNATHEKSMYLIQTADFSENLMHSEKNVMDTQISRELFREIRNLVDALHGEWIHLDSEKGRLEIYNTDVSQYVLGYLMGVEWEEAYVEFINRINYDVRPYQGAYLRCSEDASPFESFLAEWGDWLLRYEMEQYQTQGLITFCNWPETDPFVNEIMPFSPGELGAEPQLEAQLDVEHIRGTDQLKTGIFASYNVYPYFPLFLQYGQYTLCRDETGNHNPYRGYLQALVEHHSYPVLISEYGVPASRDKAHAEIWRGYIHGGLNESEQAAALRTLYRDIRSAGCAGSLVFSWHDEWAKRTWNDKRISDSNGTVQWSNMESAEQFFGLLAFDPGDGETEVYPDGSPGEWLPEYEVQEQDDMTLSTQYDERYLYFMVQDFDPARKIQIALDTLPEAGVQDGRERSFSRGVEFLLQYDPREGMDLMIHNDYSVLPFCLSDKVHAGITDMEIQRLSRNYPPELLGLVPSNEFSVVRGVSGSIFGYMRNLQDVDMVGHMIPGDTNPDHPGYNSNADYYIAEDMLEVRIPWQLLNFRDPSQPFIVDRITPEHRYISNLRIDGIYVSVYGDDRKNVEKFAFCRLPGWREPRFHERLKPAYYALQEEFKGAD